MHRLEGIDTFARSEEGYLVAEVLALRHCGYIETRSCLLSFDATDGNWDGVF